MAKYEVISEEKIDVRRVVFEKYPEEKYPNGLKNSDMRSFCAGTKEAYSGLKVSANIDNLAA